MNQNNKAQFDNFPWLRNHWKKLALVIILMVGSIVLLHYLDYLVKNAFFGILLVFWLLLLPLAIIWLPVRLFKHKVSIAVQTADIGNEKHLNNLRKAEKIIIIAAFAFSLIGLVASFLWHRVFWHRPPLGVIFWPLFSPPLFISALLIRGIVLFKSAKIWDRKTLFRKIVAALFVYLVLAFFQLLVWVLSMITSFELRGPGF